MLSASCSERWGFMWTHFYLIRWEQSNPVNVISHNTFLSVLFWLYSVHSIVPEWDKLLDCHEHLHTQTRGWTLLKWFWPFYLVPPPGQSFHILCEIVGHLLDGTAKISSRCWWFPDHVLMTLLIPWLFLQCHQLQSQARSASTNSKQVDGRCSVSTFTHDSVTRLNSLKCYCQKQQILYFT